MSAEMLDAILESGLTTDQIAAVGKPIARAEACALVIRNAASFMESKAASGANCLEEFQALTVATHELCLWLEELRGALAKRYAVAQVPEEAAKALH
ncbi:MAG: hypothetical protein ACM3SS_19640 [Rhodospirillaceae bacterium]